MQWFKSYTAVQVYAGVRHLQRVSSQRIRAVVVEGGERRAGAESTTAQSR